MRSGRRRPTARPSKLPLRVARYRRHPTPSPSSHLAEPTARLAQLKTTRRPAAPPFLPTAPPTVTAERLALTLPIPPSINHQYATVNGRRLLSSAGRAFKSQVSGMVWLALTRSPARTVLMRRLHTEPLALSIRFFFTSALRRDVDGGLKIAQDAICEGLGLNDNRIVETHLYKDLDKARPRMEVTICPVPRA